MSSMRPPSDSWSVAWGEILQRLAAADITSRNSHKFDEFAAWLEDLWDLPAGAVVCKYVQHAKNRWNRLREASRRQPVAIVLLFEGDDHGDLVERVSSTAGVCPTLEFVVTLIRSGKDSWALSALVHRASTRLPPTLASVPMELAFSFEAEPLSGRERPLPSSHDMDKTILRNSLEALGLEGGDPSSPHRTRAAEELAKLTGRDSGEVSFKTVPSTKNLGNRLGEALARAPGILVVVCPDVLDERVREEVGRWGDAGKIPVVLVLCGENTTLRVTGPDDALTERIRSAVEVDHLEAAVPFQAQQLWRSWTYERWNQELVAYCLRARGRDNRPVERMAATPEELALVVGGTGGDAGAVAEAFVGACVSQLPFGTSFCGFCRQDQSWSPSSESEPPFFAMLWLTCLVAYGYPEANGGFFERFWGLLGNKDHIKCLPALWSELSDWTRRRCASGGDIRELVLPPADDYRTTIGHSHFLAFPHEQDRRHIARILVDADLVGFEPPIAPVVDRLQVERDRFSRFFREDLDNFIKDFVRGVRDPRDSAFWRAVRQEALEPSYSPGARRTRRGMTSILGVFDDDGFLPLLGCAEGWAPPPGYRTDPLDNPIGGFDFYAISEAQGLDGVITSIFGSVGLLGPGPRALVNQGVLVFQEDQSDEFYLVSGHDINGADAALVRDDLLDAFVQAFDGRGERSRVPGWSVVTGCRVRPLDALPPGLSGALQLLRTMNPPSVRFVGGIQVPGGHLGFDGLLPRVRCPEADRVEVRAGKDTLACELRPDGDWQLPTMLTRRGLPLTATVAAHWRVKDDTPQRVSEKGLHLRKATIGDHYKPLVGGQYFIEACCPGQLGISAGQDIPLGITVPEQAGSCDLLEYEPSARYLGPGLGQMAAEPAEGFDWLAVGHKGRPELLVFIGNADAPVPPANTKSPHPGDRRHWKSAFSKARRALVRRSDGGFAPIADHAPVLGMKKTYARHKPTEDADAVPETRLETLAMEPPGRCAPHDSTIQVADALAALSVRRGGLRYRTVQQLFAELTGMNVPSLHFELLRAWAECGAVDVVRHQSYSATRVVARRPRLVAVRRGPDFEATLMGLLTRSRTAQVRRVAGEHGLVLHDVRPGCPWQPAVLRVRGSLGELMELGRVCALEPLEWLRWDDTGELPSALRVHLQHQGLRTDAPPAGFEAALWWWWDKGEFRRNPPERGQVLVEQRVHRDSCSIYVVTVDDQPQLWTYIRNWALLFAHEVADRAPFALDNRGWVTTSGRSPVHLPLALGRLCTVLGEGTPGPTLESSNAVGGYCYPFGRRITTMVSRVLPGDWLVEESS